VIPGLEWNVLCGPFLVSRTGVLLGLREGKVRLRTAAGEMEFDRGNLDKARVVPRFDGLMKSGEKLVEEVMRK